MNLSTTIAPKSDQTNADDLLAGPRTIKITEVKVVSGEQPVVIHYEGDNGRPYKPGKSMRRALVAMWGGEGAAYVGRRLTLYADPAVKFGGVAVGGIRISHASDINGTMHLMLTETRGKKKPFTIEPLPVEKVAAKAVQSQAAAPDASLDDAIWAAEAIGEEKAREGLASLAVWWKGLPKAVQSALEKKKNDDWKPAAEAAKGAAA
jgi:hypothetical protein